MKNTEIVWHVMRIPYNREMLFKNHLDTIDIENFIPMHYKYVEKKGQKIKVLVPVVNNLVFVKTSRAVLNKVKTEVELRFPVRYMMDRVRNEPMVVPENQMNNFLSVAKTYDDQLIYLDSSEVLLRRGDKVRITQGPLAGVVGEFLRIRGDRRVVVSVDGLMSVATAYIAPYQLERLEEPRMYEQTILCETEV
ncbi:MAG: UpxY family transcription antiterminator [Dysgonomonas sp.]|uniref:UpxY family transcription antiterminator n=1 Tax=Dysgonomonas TaxID=156973 RepID=UPI0033406004